MNKSEILAALSNRAPGQVATVTVERAGKVRAQFKGLSLFKRSTFQIQLASYANRAPVREAVANGDREAPELPVWIESSEMTSNGIRFWHGKTGSDYLAMPRFGDKATAEWILDGKAVDLETVKPFLLASEYAEKPSKSEVEDKGQAMFNAITLSNITDIR